jgi:hypothetical protein
MCILRDSEQDHVSVNITSKCHYKKLRFDLRSTSQKPGKVIKKLLESVSKVNSESIQVEVCFCGDITGRYNKGGDI